MRFRNRIVWCVIPLTLVLTGCFQQAGTALQEPISVTNQAVVVPPATTIPLPTQADSSTGGSDNGQGQITPTINPLPDTLSTDAPTGGSDTTIGAGNTDTGNPPVALTIISATLPPLPT